MKTRQRPTNRSSETRHVLLLIESSRAYGRGCLLGIASYMRTHQPWNIWHIERGILENVPAIVRQQEFDGVITRIETEEVARSVEKLGAPSVDLRAMFTPSRGVAFDTDPDGCAEMAVDHFYQRGFRHLAFCGYCGVNFSDQRREAFIRRCAERGLVPEVHELAFKANTRASRVHTAGVPSGTPSREAQGEFPEKQLINWLSALPGPVGIFACNDVRGRQVLQAASLAGRRTPDEIAVLGVDDDEVICELANPPLSSIEPDTHRMGFEGAACLDDLMRGVNPSPSPILIPPRRVVVRLSTDLLAIDDADIASAIRFIREQACNGVGVNDVAESIAVSRVTLERRFRLLLNRSPREEIERVRMERVRVLLTQTNYSLIKIALDTGYLSDAHLVTAFRRHENCTPGNYRKRFKHSN